MKKKLLISLILPAFLLSGCNKKCTDTEFDCTVSELQFRDPVDFVVDAKIKDGGGTKTYNFRMSEIKSTSPTSRLPEDEIIEFILGKKPNTDDYQNAKYFIGDTLKIKFKGEAYSFYLIFLSLFQNNVIEFDKNGNMIRYKGPYNSYATANMNVTYTY